MLFAWLMFFPSLLTPFFNPPVVLLKIEDSNFGSAESTNFLPFLT